MVDLTGASLTWNGLTLYGQRSEGDFAMSELSGWEELPQARVTSRPRPNAHGSFSGRVLAGSRQVIVSGVCGTAARRDELLLSLQSSLSFPGDPGASDDLSVTLAGRTLTATAQLVALAPKLDVWGAGVFGWSAQWLCDDPFRYASEVTESTGLAVAAGGLAFDLFTDGTTDVNELDFGAAGTSGKVSLSNPGTAESRPVFTVSGTMPSGFELVETYTGSRLRYEGAVSVSGDSVTLDSSSGRVRLGASDRGGLLTRADWWGVPASGVREVLFTTLGSYEADANLSVTYRPTYW